MSLPTVSRPGHVMKHALFACLVLCAPGTAFAQASGSSGAASAQVLFEQASAELDAGKYASACKKLEEVTRLVPDGTGAKEALAECYEKLGKLASAWSQYVAAAELSEQQNDKRRAAANSKHAGALKPRLASLTIEVPAEVRAIAGITVTRNGIPVGEAQWNITLPVDRELQEIVAAAPGYKAFRTSIAIAKDGDSARTSIMPLEKLPVVRETVSPPPAEERVASWRLPLSAGGTGLGAASVVAGVALYVISSAKYDEAKVLHDQIKSDPSSNYCSNGPSPHLRCGELKSAVELSDALYSPGVALIVGGSILTVASGIYLGVTLQERTHRKEKQKESREPRLTSIGARGSTLFLQGSF